MRLDLGCMFRLVPQPIQKPRTRIELSEWPAAIYAIGDIHGCLKQLQSLQSKIIEDGSRVQGRKLIVCLGDYVDRGPDSAGVLDFLNLPLPSDFERICLVGNHEVMMLDHLRAPKNVEGWFNLGGRETLASYGIEPDRYTAASHKERLELLRSYIPSQHIDFLEALPALLSFPGVAFVHAGLRFGVPFKDQRDDDLFWMSGDPKPFISSEADFIVVHGHIAGSEPLFRGNWIGIDTGAYATGRLTALCLARGTPHRLIHAEC